MKFVKMHGAGNDFVLVSDRDCGRLPAEKITQICHRQRGIGADGIIQLTQQGAGSELAFRFYNCDGSEADVCGNGLRCAAIYARRYLDCGDLIVFVTRAGKVRARVLDDRTVSVEMPVVKPFEPVVIEQGMTSYYGSTGVPHVVCLVADAKQVDVVGLGASIRQDPIFAPEGTNVNFVSYPAGDGPFAIRTYERGVESETLACGTGITAAGICLGLFHHVVSPIAFRTRDNERLSVAFRKTGSMVMDIWLTGPAEEVFAGNYSC